MSTKKNKYYFLGGDYAAIAGQIVNNGMQSGELMNNPNITKGQKFALLAGNLGGGMVGGQIANTIVGNQLQQKQAGIDEFNSVLKSNYMEMGGDLLEMGGFTHEDQSPDNINSGNLIKSGNDGNHIVEKNETLKDGYVYSNSLLVPDKNITFAQASKKINNLYKERQNDSIFKKAKERDLKELAEQNDIVKSEYELQEDIKMKCGGKMYFKGGKIAEGDYDIDMTPEEIQYLNSLGYDIEIT